MSYENQPLFNNPAELDGRAVSPQIPELKPPYELEVLKPVEPVEYAVFTHCDTLTRLWHAAIARNVSPWGVLGTALAYTSAAVEPNVQTPPIIGGNGSLNLLVGIVGAPGAGKGASQNVVEEFLRFSQASFHVDIEELPLGTGQGIAEQFRPPTPPKGKPDPDAPPPQQLTRALFVASEIDGLAASTQQRGSTLMSVLRKVWSGENPGNTNGSRETTRNVPKHSYRAGLICSIQPERSGCLLNDAEAAGGTPQRWLWMECDNYPLSQRQADTRLVQAHVTQLPNEFWEPGAYVMGLPEHVWAHTKAMAVANVEGKAANSLDAHANMTRIKVACLLAIMDGRGTVSDSDWSVSGLVMSKSDQARRRCQDALKAVESRNIQRRAERDGELIDARERDGMNRAKSLIIKALQASGELKWSGQKQLHQKCGRQREYAATALQESLEDGHVQSREVIYGDGSQEVYYYLPD